MLKSIGAIFAGFSSVVVLSVVTDLVLVARGIFPPQNEPAVIGAVSWSGGSLKTGSFALD